MTMRPLRFSVLLLWTVFLAPIAFVSAQSAAPSENHPVEIAMKNVMYHFTDHIAVHIIQLQGHLLPAKPGTVVFFDDKNSFILAMASAEISISCSDLARVLNENVFSASDSPIKDIGIERKNNQLIIRGKLPQKAGVSFETAGTISAERDGRIRLHTEHVKAARLPVKGLLDLLGIDLARLIDTKNIHGVAVDKDDLLLDPQLILPPPRIQGKVTAVRIQGNDIVQVFGDKPSSNFAARQTGNYIAFRHGEMRFGKLTMHDADLIMIDMDPADPFDFFLDHYQEELVAGYTKSTPEYGLRTYTKDYNKLRRRTSKQ